MHVEFGGTFIAELWLIVKYFLRDVNYHFWT